MASVLTGLVHHFGVLAVLVLMTAESCGVPVPSEVVMPAAGAGAAAGLLNLPLVVLAGGLGNLLGSLVAYEVAARWGEPFLLGPGRWIGIRRHHVEIADRWFRRWGLWAVFFGRLLPVVRTYISFPAGLAGVGRARFAVLTFVGALPWCAFLAAVGYALGANYERVTVFVQRGAYVIAVIVLALVVAWFVVGRRAEPNPGA